MSGQKQEGAAEPLHTALPGTVEDALGALDSASNSGLAFVGRVLDALVCMSKRADPGADDVVGRIVEGAYQSGFQLLDNNAGLLVVSEADLVSFVAARQALHETKGRNATAGSLVDSEQYRMQIAAICTAAIGYCTPDKPVAFEYRTPALRDVQRLYSRYAALHAQLVALGVCPAGDEPEQGLDSLGRLT